MQASLAGINRKPPKTTGNHSKERRRRPRFQLPRLERIERIQDVEWDEVMRDAVHKSGMSDYEVADSIPLSHGHMSKVLKGTAGLFGDRFVRYMRITGSLGPLQWLADQMGCDIVQRPVPPHARESDDQQGKRLS